MPGIMIACCLSLDYLGRKSIKIYTHGLFGEEQNYNDHRLTLVIQESVGATQVPAETWSLLKA